MTEDQKTRDRACVFDFSFLGCSGGSVCHTACVGFRDSVFLAPVWRLWRWVVYLAGGVILVVFRFWVVCEYGLARLSCFRCPYL